MPPARTSPAREAPLFCNRGPALRLELRVRAAAAGDEPFVALGDRGRVGRVLLGRVAIGEDTTVRELAIKLRRDTVFAPTSGFRNASLTNVEIDAMWRRECELLGTHESDSIVERFDLASQSESPPVTYCKKTREFFHPVSRRGNPLTVCRDDELLRACGLHPYSAGTMRYLFAPAEVADRSANNQLFFYTVGPSEREYPHPDVEVRRGGQLYRDLATLVNGAQDEGEPTIRELVATLPCMTCSSRQECYQGDSDPQTAVLAEERLVPLTYFDSEVVALELCHLRYDEVVDVLGGADWRDLEARADGPGTGGRQQVTGALGRALSVGRQYISTADDRRPMEVLGLKLSTFRQLCQGLRELHAKSGWPCFGVSPENVMAKFGGGGEAVPSRWQFRARLIGLGAAQPYRPPTAGTHTIPEVWIPVADVNRDFLSPLVTGSNLGRDYLLRFTVTDYSPAGDQYRVRIEGRTSGDRLEGIECGDLLFLQPNAPVRQLAGIDLVATVTASEERRLEMELSIPNTKLPETWSLPFAFDGIAVAYPKLGPACDLYGLGMMLFRSLLVNDKRSFGDMLDSVGRVLQKFDLELSGGDGPDSSHADGTLQRLVREAGRGFGCEEILYRSSDREWSQDAIPRRLWREIVSFGFRLLSNVGGFSFAVHHGDHGSDSSVARDGDAALMSNVLAELDRFLARVDVEQFGGAARDEEVVALCETLIVEMGEKMVGAAQSPASEMPADRSAESAEDPSAEDQEVG